MSRRFADRERPALGDLLGDGRRPGDGLAGGHDLMDQADPLASRASRPGR
jgi:hypothetical protein